MVFTVSDMHAEMKQTRAEVIDEVEGWKRNEVG